MNVSEENVQQNDPNRVSDPLHIPEKPKPGLNYWMVSTIMLLIVLIGLFVWFYFKYVGNNDSENQASNLPTPSPYVSADPVSLETIDLNTQSIGDSVTELFFSENNTVYSTRNEGLVKKLSTLDGNITNILFLPGKKDLLIVTENPEVVEEIYDEATDRMVPVTNFHTAYWIFKQDTQKLEKFPYELSEPSPLREIEDMTKFVKIYTNESKSEGVDIILDKLDGSSPSKIGYLKDKLLERQTCEVGDDCIEKYFPESFIPSFDGSFLLNSPPRGGGLGEQAKVVSRDGSKIYDIDFYWYTSSAIWLDNNKLLTQDRDRAKISSFNSDGTLETINVPNTVGEVFNQRTLSPNRRYVGVITYNPNYEVGLFDVDSFQKTSIETIESGDVDPNGIRIIGWSNDSNKMLYVVGDSAKIYNRVTGKAYAVALLTNGAPDWVKVNKMLFALNIFEIR